MSCLLVLALGASLAAMAESTSTTADGDLDRFRDAFAPHFRVGAALGRKQLLGEEPGTLTLVAEQFDALTAENDMKWEWLQPGEDRFDFRVSDRLVEFADRHAIEVTGHVLLWHSQTPDWVFREPDGSPVSRERLLGRLERHIRTVMGRYAGRVAAWDVVNEALEEDGSLRDSSWRRILGDDYVIEAFRIAEAVDPAALLIYNDYNLFKPAKREGAVRLVRSLQAAGVRIDAVGMQGHYSLGIPEDLSEVEASIRAFAETGVRVMITELDVSVLPFPEDAEQGAEIDQNLELRRQLDPYRAGLPDDVVMSQAERYEALFTLFLKHATAIDRVTFWGVSDRQSWRNNWPMRGRTDYPLVFDRDNRPKPIARRLWALGRQASSDR